MICSESGVIMNAFEFERIHMFANSDNKNIKSILLRLCVPVVIALVVQGLLISCTRTPSTDGGSDQGSAEVISDVEGSGSAASQADLNPVTPAADGDELLHFVVQAEEVRETWALETSGLNFSDGGSIRIVPIPSNEVPNVDVYYSSAMGEITPEVEFEDGVIRISTPDEVVDNASFTCNVYANVSSASVSGSVSLDWNCKGIKDVSMTYSTTSELASTSKTNVNLYELDCDSLNISATGPASWMLMGDVADVQLAASDGAYISGNNLFARKAILVADSSAWIEMSVLATLNATTSDGGRIDYMGTPEAFVSGENITQVGEEVGRA